NITTAFHGDAFYLLAVRLESTFNSHTVRNFTHGKRRIDAPVANTDDHTLVSLKPFAVTIGYFYLNNDCVARSEFGNVFFQLFSFQYLDDFVFRTHKIAPLVSRL